MRILCLTILLGCPLLGQLDSGSLTVTVIRTMAVQPDQAAFSASVTAGSDTALDEILAAVAPAGITAANMTGVSGDVTRVTYYFDWLVPISKIKETAAALQSLKVDFAVTNAGVSDDLLAPSRCPTSDLLADAAMQARKMAGAIGASVGPVLAVSNTGATLPVVAVTGQFAFGGVLLGLPDRVQLPSSTQLNCMLTVKFKLN